MDLQKNNMSSLNHTILDLDEIVQAKIKKNAEKYPVEMAYGNKAKYTELKESYESKE